MGGSGTSCNMFRLYNPWMNPASTCSEETRFVCQHVACIAIVSEAIGSISMVGGSQCGTESETRRALRFPSPSSPGPSHHHPAHPNLSDFIQWLLYNLDSLGINFGTLQALFNKRSKSGEPWSQLLSSDFQDWRVTLAFETGWWLSNVAYKFVGINENSVVVENCTPK
jgi:hypothetical protein